MARHIKKHIAQDCPVRHETEVFRRKRRAGPKSKTRRSKDVKFSSCEDIESEPKQPRMEEDDEINKTEFNIIEGE